MTKIVRGKKTLISLIVITALLLTLVLCSILVHGNETHRCHTCEEQIACPACAGAEGENPDCDLCHGNGIYYIHTDPECEDCGGTGIVNAASRYSETFLALLAPVIAIALALITKEVYSSLFIGVLIGGFLYGGYRFTDSMNAVVNDGTISAVTDTAGIFVFLVVLGILVALINRAGGSQAFGRWAETHVKTRVGALLATFALGVLIFIDDYFNCLTVGSVMRPVTDKHQISRPKLAYIIDATAAPICMIAPISTWAAAVANYAPEGQELSLFIQAIPYNFYSLLTIVFVITISILGFDYGKMRGFEIKARNEGDLSALNSVSDRESELNANSRGRVFDLILPIIVLIATCIFGLVYSGGMFTADSGYYGDFIGAFGNADAGSGLAFGGIISLVVIIFYLMARRLIGFKDAMEAIPKGFVAMVPAILILTLATALKNTTSLLGAKYFVANLLEGAGALRMFLPAIIFLIACALSFATGTSWGTFGILLPIVLAIFTPGTELYAIGMSACLAGAVCGDHCSPISDTTIMASAGAQCNHVEHVATQLPYAVTVAAISFVSFLLAGLIQIIWIVLPLGILLTVGTLVVLRTLQRRRDAGLR